MSAVPIPPARRNAIHFAGRNRGASNRISAGFRSERGRLFIASSHIGSDRSSVKQIDSRAKQSVREWTRPFVIRSPLPFFANNAPNNKARCQAPCCYLPTSSRSAHHRFRAHSARKHDVASNRIPVSLLKRHVQQNVIKRTLCFSISKVYLPVDIVWDGEEVTTCIKMEADWVTDIFSQVIKLALD